VSVDLHRSTNKSCRFQEIYRNAISTNSDNPKTDMIVGGIQLNTIIVYIFSLERILVNGDFEFRIILNLVIFMNFEVSL
jgi:hypothetical protein